MRIVSLVPSLTESLTHANCNVVGRTRFCIHPNDVVKNITVVGGTKTVDWQKVLALQPDLLILDKEENTKAIAEASPIPFYATHVQSIANTAAEMRGLAKRLANKELHAIAERWSQIANKQFSILEPPGILEWIKKPEVNFQKALYLIWRDPWMTVSKDTFIGSVLQQFGFQLYSFDKKYPEVDLHSFSIKDTLLLFSSEPYPFVQKKAELAKLPFASALVDGEAYSWFGVRSLRFLESL